MLCGWSGEGFAAEVGEFLDRSAGVGQPVLELDDLVLQAVDLGRAGIWGLSGLAEAFEPLPELVAQVGVGAIAVEGGAVDVGFAGKG